MDSFLNMFGNEVKHSYSVARARIDKRLGKISFFSSQSKVLQYYSLKDAVKINNTKKSQIIFYIYMILTRIFMLHIYKMLNFGKIKV